MAIALPVLRRAWRSLCRPAWKPLLFPTERFVPISADTVVKEENAPDYVASRYYPVRIGEVFRERYQVVGKLGYGITSTVWLARDLTLANADMWLLSCVRLGYPEQPGSEATVKYLNTVLNRYSADDGSVRLINIDASMA